MTQQTFYSFQVKRADGSAFNLSELKGKLVLVVNVASRCGFTPQYEGLEQVYKKYRDKGLEILAFPCNQFGAQEPGSNEEIQGFCKLNYGLTFPVLGKVDVNGGSADPLWNWLKSSAPGILGTEAIKWNFTKFLVDRQGQVIDRYSPQTTPSQIEKEIESKI